MSSEKEVDSNFDEQNRKKSSIYTVIDAWNNEIKAYLKKVSTFSFFNKFKLEKILSQKTMWKTKVPDDPSILILFIFVYAACFLNTRYLKGTVNRYLS